LCGPAPARVGRWEWTCTSPGARAGGPVGPDVCAEEEEELSAAWDPAMNSAISCAVPLFSGDVNTAGVLASKETRVEGRRAGLGDTIGCRYDLHHELAELSGWLGGNDLTIETHFLAEKIWQTQHIVCIGDEHAVDCCRIDSIQLKHVQNINGNA
jgi:hypothetical protein